jgi:ComF family protein
VCALCAAKPGHVQFIRPPYCERCGLPYAGEFTAPFVCGNCAELNLQFDAARAAVKATEFMLDVIHRYKYRRALWFEPFLTRLLLLAALPQLQGERWDAIVPVPLHPARQREREFNQADRLATQLARASGVSVRREIVRRARPTRTQACLDRQERSTNVAGVFVARPGVRLDQQRLIVVDDVLTTGATTSAVSAVLRRAGAAAILVWTVARGV